MAHAWCHRRWRDALDARGFALRDGFGDFLRGLRSVEEERDAIDYVSVAAAPEPRRASQTNQLQALTDRLEQSADKPSTPAEQPVDIAAQLLFSGEDLNLTDAIDAAIQGLGWSDARAKTAIAGFVKTKFDLPSFDACDDEQKRQVLNWLESRLRNEK